MSTLCPTSNKVLSIAKLKLPKVVYFHVALVSSTKPAVESTILLIAVTSVAVNPLTTGPKTLKAFKIVNYFY